MSSLPPLNLDDRNFHDLLQMAQERAQSVCPAWDTAAVGDPGNTLVELFAYLTDVLLYRVNRIPEKAYVEFLRLLGVTLDPPRAASTRLQFRLDAARDADLLIPRGTRVAAATAPSGGGAPPVFSTSEELRIKAGDQVASVVAHHCDRVEFERVPLERVGEEWRGRVAQAPVLALAGLQHADLIVALPLADHHALPPGARGAEIDKRTHLLLREAPFLSDAHLDRFVVDRRLGEIRISVARRDGDAADAEAPELRVSYRTGGGDEGNLSPGQLTRLLDPIAAGLTVLQPERSTGGRASEGLDGALRRGPREFRSRPCALTAEDFEHLAVRSSGAVARTRAFSARDLFPHAQAGTVDLFLVPHISESIIHGDEISLDLVRSHQRKDVLAEVSRELDARRPLGTHCRVRWTPMRPVRARMQLVAFRNEDTQELADRIRSALYQRISPLPRGQGQEAWSYGASLRRHLVDQIVVAEPGIRYAESLTFEIDNAPDHDVSRLLRDPHRPGTYLAGLATNENDPHPLLFRSLNDGRSWEPVELQRQDDEQAVLAMATHPHLPGYLAVVTRRVDRKSRVRLSHDLGETWTREFSTDYQVNDVAWLQRGGETVLLVATDAGLFELENSPHSAPAQLVVDAKEPDLGFTRIETAQLIRGVGIVVLSARERKGVFISSNGGQANSFTGVGPSDDARCFAVERSGGRTYLWAGFGADGDSPGFGVRRRELREDAGAEGDWEEAPRGWSGGSCTALGISGRTLYASTHRSGVLRMDLNGPRTRWTPIAIDRGLGLSAEHFVRIDDLITGSAEGDVLVAGKDGLRRSLDAGENYEEIASRSFEDAVHLPPHWVFCSGEHVVDVRIEADE